MKTRITQIAVALFAAVSLGQIALAGPSHPVKRQTSGPANRADCCVTHSACKGVACCDTKMKSSALLGGRSSYSSLKKVRGCTGSCPIAHNDKAEVCRKGAKG